MEQNVVFLIDIRERALLSELVQNQTDENCKYQSVMLDVADIQFVTQTTEEDHAITKIDIAIERKSISDFCSSVKDGRYREQKYRLIEHVKNAHGGKVMYLIEGRSEGLHTSGNRRFEALRQDAVAHGLHPSALQTCVTDMLLSDIPVIFTDDIKESSLFLVAMWNRFAKRKESEGHEHAAHTSITRDNYNDILASSAKRGKHITPRTCYITQLCQIPGVSAKRAKDISEKWPTLLAFFRDLDGKSHSERISLLMTINGIGKKGAEQILNHVFVE